MQHHHSPAEQFEHAPVKIFPTARTAAIALAEEVQALITTRIASGRSTVLGLATGSTPVPFYRELVRLHREEGLSFRTVITFNLDEYSGLTRDHRESYSRFMQDQLFRHIDILPENIHIPDGTIPIGEVFDHCAAYEESIRAHGGIDLQILGIGRTGHIGFNEPGSLKTSRTRLIPLDKVTRSDAASDFNGLEHVPRFAITMGVGTILEARRIVLMAWGENKASIAARAIEGPETDTVSASFLQAHSDASYYLNAAASSALTRVRLPWLVGRARWDAGEVRRAIVWLAQKTGKAVLKLVESEYNENGMAELLTQGSHAYDHNITIFNSRQHTLSGWPGGKKDDVITTRPVGPLPYPKTCVVIAPEPQDDIMGMGGTIERLVSQGHHVHILYLTSGDLRVTDAEALRFGRVLLETGRQDPAQWAEPARYATEVLAEIQAKGPFGEPPPRLRALKAHIRHGEAQDAAMSLGVLPGHLHFLDLPFYRLGRYRQFTLTTADLSALAEVLARFAPHQIYITGNLADPSSVQGQAFAAFRTVMEQTAAWQAHCSVWLYRGHQPELELHEIDMAIPMSPDQLVRKISAMHKYLTHTQPELLDGQRNRDTARAYDAFGMAEYEAIEAFQQWRPTPRLAAVV